jgi:sulfate adenylyltransferase subunit 1 (EFTu-like GTPase family)
MVTSIEHRINVSTLEMEPETPELAMNDIGEIRLRTSKPLIFDGYATIRLIGSFILVDQGTNATVGAGMLFPPTEVARPE